MTGKPTPTPPTPEKAVSAPPRERWTLILTAADDNFPPMACRMKRVHKMLLRAYGIRCIGYGPDEPAEGKRQ